MSAIINGCFKKLKPGKSPPRIRENQCPLFPHTFSSLALRSNKPEANGEKCSCESTKDFAEFRAAFPAVGGDGREQHLHPGLPFLPPSLGQWSSETWEGGIQAGSNNRRWHQKRGASLFLERQRMGFLLFSHLSLPLLFPFLPCSLARKEGRKGEGM